MCEVTNCGLMQKNKKSLHIEPYLPHNIPVKYIACFRLSAPKLKIEVDKYHKAFPTPVDQRLCQQCQLGEIEDETHFMYNCPKYTNERTELRNTLKHRGFDLPCLDAIELPSLFAIEDRKIISSVGNYIYKCMKLRGQNVIDTA